MRIEVRDQSSRFVVSVNPVTSPAVRSYLRGDWVREQLREFTDPKSPRFSGDAWLLESPAKRYIYNALYGGFFATQGKKILDVGGGMTALMKAVSARHSYTLVDIMTHEEPGLVSRFVKRHKIRWIKKSWHEVRLNKVYDCIIANDLFPNVDQRLDEFFTRYFPLCREMRLSITTYTEGKFYKVKRMDADEILFVKPWTPDDFVSWLSRVSHHHFSLKRLFPADMEVFPNGRLIVLLTAKKL